MLKSKRIRFFQHSEHKNTIYSNERKRTLQFWEMCGDMFLGTQNKGLG